MKLRQRKPLPKTKRALIDEDYEEQNRFINVDSSNDMVNGVAATREKRVRKNVKTPIQIDSQQEDKQEVSESIQQQNKVLIKDRFIEPQIEMLLFRRQSVVKDVDSEGEEQGEKQFLVKFRGLSYHHCVWMTQHELSQKGYDLDTLKSKGVNSRMSRLQRLKLSTVHYYDPKYTIPDRILSSTDLFSAIHHKKANQIKGTWFESIQIVCLKLLNFEKKKYPFGTLLLEEIPVFQKQQKPHSEPLFTLQVILNKLYFGLYPSYERIWDDIGRAIKKYQIRHADENTDYYVVGETMRQCAIFLYIQWYLLSRERFWSCRQEFRKITDSEGDPEAEKLRNLCKLEEKFCKSNVFKGEKSAESPKNAQELDRLNPGTLSLKWIGLQVPPYEYKWINEDDMAKLDLNVQVDRYYLVKWRELGYQSITWQRESIIGHPDKLQEFRVINKMPNKETREGLELNLRLKRQMNQFYEKNGQSIQRGKIKVPFPIEDIENKLYLVKQRYEKPKEYRGKDVITFKNYRLLKDFQNQSLNWFIRNWYQNRNTILADEMGLGKTIQVLAFLYHLYMYEKVLGPFLVLAPLTTLNQWRRQIQGWTNFNCLLYYDEANAGGRPICQSLQFFFLHTKKNGEVVKSQIPKFHILLTSYECFQKDFKVIQQIAFQHIVVDEAHRLKNPKSLLAKAIKAMGCRRLTLMTGTPVQNNTKQLWALLHLIAPRQFSSQEQFVKRYGNLNTREQVQSLKKLVKPYMLRRVKEDVEKAIPRLSQIIIDVEMTTLQKAIYKGLLERNKGDIIKGLNGANFNNLAMQFRKCCNHPFLISDSIETQLLSDCLTEEERNEKFLNASGKATLLVKILEKFKKQKKKTLLFSQFVTVLEMLIDFLQQRGFRCELLHGGIKASSRHRAISRFCEDGQVDVFLISTKAGGVGINLTAATEIIIFDSDWNPQNDIQATARAHRIGQKQEVTVYRLITSNSYEAQMFKIASKKLGMDKAILNGDYFKNSGSDYESALSKHEVETLLKKGVLGFLQNSTNQSEYFKQDIDEILEKNARKVEYALGGDGCTYSKSKFVGEKGGQHLDLNAQNFWQVALRDIESPAQRLGKRLQDSNILNSLEQQQNLMIEALQVVIQLTRQRISGTAYNAEDERILINFLQKVNGERRFHRQYRALAYRFLEQIQKPSRRFKVSLEDIRKVRDDVVDVEAVETAVVPPINYPQDQEQGTPDKQSQEKTPESIHQRQNGRKLRKQTRNNRQHESQDKKQQTTNLRVDYQKVCFECLKPKCSIFCKGPCHRAFHQLCWRRSQSGIEEIAAAIQLEQMGMEFNQWVLKIERGLVCQSCSMDHPMCPCSICGEMGIIEEGGREPQSMLACRFKACQKYYHIRCLGQSEFSEIVAQGNKRAVDLDTLALKLSCPAHFCFKCGIKINKQSWQATCSCVNCCKSFHLKCLSEERASGRLCHLSSSYYICSDHLSPHQRVNLQQEYQLLNNDKRYLKELKKLEKMQKQFKKSGIESQIIGISRGQNQQRQFSYEDFGICTLEEQDYKNYEGYWCRYCGSRFADGFAESPWGSNKLCLHHNRLWKKGKLELDGYDEDPLEPLMLKQTQLKFLNRIANEHFTVPPNKIVAILLAKTNLAYKDT